MKRSWWRPEAETPDRQPALKCADLAPILRNPGDIDDNERYALTLELRDHILASFSRLVGQTLTHESLSERANNCAAGILGLGIELRRTP